MRSNTQDKTLHRNYISKWRYMIKDYELVKNKRHPKFRFVSDFYKKVICRDLDIIFKVLSSLFELSWR